MYNSELTIRLEQTDIKIFMQPGFFLFEWSPNPVHRHHYTEFHFIEQGECEFFFDRQKFSLKAGDVVVIPAGSYHYYTNCSPDLRHCAFQTTLACEHLTRFTVSRAILSDMFHYIEAYARSGRRVRLAAYLGLLCSMVAPDEPQGMPPIEDRNLLIYEFFATRYSQDVTLGDLASQLNLSKKQTERLVEQYTGHNFRAEIARRRIEAAIQLMRIENLTLGEVARRVGYKSYSGFWKSYKAALQNTKE